MSRGGDRVTEGWHNLADDAAEDTEENSWFSDIMQKDVTEVLPRSSKISIDPPQPVSSEKDGIRKCFDSFMHCHGPAHQLYNYYLNGTLDSCEQSKTELINCIKHTFGHAESSQLVWQAQEDWDSRPSPSADVWDNKDQPCWSNRSKTGNPFSNSTSGDHQNA